MVRNWWICRGNTAVSTSTLWPSSKLPCKADGQIQALAAINEEIENIRQAWRFAVAQQDVQAVDDATAHALPLFVHAQLVPRRVDAV